MWQTKILSQHNCLVYVYNLTETDLEAYYFIEIQQNKYELLEKSVKTDKSIDLSEYGKIVKKGWGIPSKELIRELELTYGKIDL